MCDVGESVLFSRLWKRRVLYLAQSVGTWPLSRVSVSWHDTLWNRRARWPLVRVLMVHGRRNLLGQGEFAQIQICQGM